MVRICFNMFRKQISKYKEAPLINDIVIYPQINEIIIDELT